MARAKFKLQTVLENTYNICIAQIDNETTISNITTQTQKMVHEGTCLELESHFTQEEQKNLPFWEF